MRIFGLLVLVLAGCNRAVPAAPSTPHCEAPAIDPGLAMYGAVEVARDAPEKGRRITSYGNLFELDPEPSVAGPHFKRITFDPASPTALTIELTPEGTKALETATERLAKAGASMAIMHGAESIMAARVMETVKEGTLQVTTGQKPAHALLQRLCTKITSP